MDISAIITTYNRDTVVVDAIKSVFSQSIAPKELLIIDDGSTDNTEESVRAIISDAPFPTFYFKKKNGGMASSLNYGIRKAAGAWVAFLDDDDLWGSSHLERIGELYINHPELRCIAGLREKSGVTESPPHHLLSEYGISKLDSDLRILSQKPLSKPFFTPVVGTAVVLRSIFDHIAFEAVAGARLDIHFFWRLSELTSIGLDMRAHGTARQYRTSLLSTDADAPNDIKERIALRRNADEISMLNDLIRSRDKEQMITFERMLQDARAGRSFLLRSHGRFGDAFRHALSCFGSISTATLIKECVLSALRLRPEAPSS